MGDEFSWFDLKKYEPSKEFDLAKWYRQVVLRSTFLQLSVGDPENFFDLFPLWCEAIKINPILKDCDSNTGSWKHFSGIDTVSTYSVRLTPLCDFLVIDDVDYFNEQQLSRISKSNYFFNNDRDKDLKEIVNKPLNLHSLDDDSYLGEINLTVDLNSTDEQIINDFKKVLSEYRKLSGHVSQEKKITPKNMKNWYEKRLLPYCDLVLVSRYEKIKIGQAKLANLLFSEEKDIDTVLRLRRTTIPNANYLFDEKTNEVMWAQLQSES